MMSRLFSASKRPPAEQDIREDGEDEAAQPKSEVGSTSAHAASEARVNTEQLDVIEMAETSLLLSVLQ